MSSLPDITRNSESVRALIHWILVLLVAAPIWTSTKAPAQDIPATPNTPAIALDWSPVPTRLLKPHEPPTGWKRHSDPDYGISWFSPSEPKKTQKIGDPPTVVYDSRDKDVGFSLFCIRADTRHQGSPKLFLDSMDDAMIKSFKRNGINAIPRPVAHVKYLNTTGRLLRIEVPGNKTSLKCDLTTPTRCYSVMAFGDHNRELYEALETFVTAIRFTDAQ